MRKIKKIKKGNKLNEVKIEKESGIFIKEKKLKIVDESKIKIPTKALSDLFYNERTRTKIWN